jgi:hypothetical protein
MALIDEYAKEIAVKKFVLPPCLHIPIAARTETVIENYVGEIVEVLGKGNPNKALLVNVEIFQS